MGLNFFAKEFVPGGLLKTSALKESLSKCSPQSSPTTPLERDFAAKVFVEDVESVEAETDLADSTSGSASKPCASKPRHALLPRGCPVVLEDPVNSSEDEHSCPEELDFADLMFDGNEDGNLGAHPGHALVHNFFTINCFLLFTIFVSIPLLELELVRTFFLLVLAVT